jgi:hypothetical protein
MIRDYAIERDDSGRPTRLRWMGDRQKPQKPTPAENLAQKWAQWTGNVNQPVAQEGT